MTLSDLIKGLKEELKHGAGDRELAPSVTVESILSPKLGLDNPFVPTAEQTPAPRARRTSAPPASES